MSDSKPSYARPLAGVAQRQVWEVHAAQLTGAEQGAFPNAPRLDALVVEEPLEIRIAGETLATTMRTPGDDAALTLGFLFAEGIVTEADDLGRIAHCGRTDQTDYGHVIDATPGPGVRLDLAALDHARRGTLTTAACGVCGRQRIEDLRQRLRPIAPGFRIPAARVLDAPSRLLALQQRFQLTGGLHAAAALDARGEPVAIAEDVGRHNAVDKVNGRLLLDGKRAPLAEPHLLVVSGRSSFEIVHKAVAMGFTALAAVSAPSSAAVDLAEAFGLGLAGFVRDGRMNLYANPDRFCLALAGAVTRRDRP